MIPRQCIYQQSGGDDRQRLLNAFLDVYNRNISAPATSTTQVIRMDTSDEMAADRTTLTGKESKRQKYVASEEADTKRWLELANEVATLERPEPNKRGTLTSIGSGIKCVGQFTLESLAELKSAQDVFYCVADSVTECFIKRLRPDALDLNVLYDDNKRRITTYVQMSEIVLHQARKGRRVCMVFYGHSGMFVLPSHRAIQIARKEGLQTKMLAAVSMEDCLFADLGIDPSFPGLQTLEATDFLIRSQPLNTDFHVIIWQVTCVGDLCFRRRRLRNDYFPILIERLQEIYGKDYEIIHYICAQYPIFESKIQRITLTDLLNPEEQKQLTGMSTFYIPPKTVRQLDIDVSLKLGVIREDAPAKLLRPGKRIIDAYTDKEKQFIKSLSDWNIPNEYIYPEETELSNILTDLSLNPTFLRHCREKGYPNLTNKSESDALHSGNHCLIRNVLKPSHTVKSAQVEVLQETFPQQSTIAGGRAIPRKSFIPHHISPIFVFNNSDSDDDNEDSRLTGSVFLRSRCTELRSPLTPHNSLNMEDEETFKSTDTSSDTSD